MKNQKRNQKTNRSAPEPHDTLAKLIEAFLKERSDGSSLATQQAHQYTLAQFVEHCGDVRIGNVTPDQLREFVQDPARTARTQRRRLTVFEELLAMVPLAGPHFRRVASGLS
jgi:hypothetical protein